MNDKKSLAISRSSHNGGIGIPLPTSATEVFYYTPLDKSIEEFRILILHPKWTDNHDEPIYCSLSHTSFGKRPKYEALSYTWGDATQTYQRNVIVNGVPLTVGHNLGSALEQLRRSVNRNLWIDALCINQADNDEKSSQIPLMPFIYERAQSCLIWLMVENDSAINTFLAKNWPLVSEEQEPRKIENSDAVKSLTELATNPYWQRVWIIQEVGSARALQVYCREYIMDWHSFIKHVREVPDLSDCIPLRLQKQIDDKYSAGHSLQHLIESHQSNLCQDPRDRVYGFVGLANDAQEFPIDYSKTLYTVWKDTVLFNIEQRYKSLEGVMKYARLVKNILGLKEELHVLESVEDMVRLYATQKVEHAGRDDCDFPQVSIPSFVRGQILHIGPTWTDIIAFPRKIIAWKLGINRHVEETDRPHVRKNSDLFFRELEKLASENVEMVTAYTVSPSWKAEPIASLNRNNDDEADPGEGRNPQSEVIEHNVARVNLHDSSSEPRLFILRNGISSADEQKYTSCIGLAPPSARAGDWICQVNGLVEAFVVRYAEGAYKVVGTAVLQNERRPGWHRMRPGPFEKPLIKAFDSRHRLDLRLDVARLFHLIR